MSCLRSIALFPLGLLFITGLGCSDGGSTDVQDADVQEADVQDSNVQPADVQDSNIQDSIGSLQPEETADAAVTPPPEPSVSYAVFEDPDSDFSTVDVYDATRELFHFDFTDPAMVNDATGDRHSGWLVEGLQLGPNNGSFGSYQIRFGTEQGERRAYFTEFEPPTICNLELSAPEQLSIYRTLELPPSE